MKKPPSKKLNAREMADRASVASRMWTHYDHAKKKNPYFCDIVKTDDLPFDFAGWNLKDCRRRLDAAEAAGTVRWDELLNCEKYEAMVDINHGNTAHAVEECFDAIAVLLRTIDVLEGRQKLGKPKNVHNKPKKGTNK